MIRRQKRNRKGDDSSPLHIAPATREASWSAVAYDTAFERCPTSAHVLSHREPKSGVALRFPHALHDASRLCACLGLALLFVSCGKKTEEPAKAAETPAAPAPAAVSDTRIESEIANALAGTAPTPVAATPSELQREAESIIAKYPDKTAADLLNVPEVSTKLRNLLGKLAQDKALQQRINGSVDLAAQIKGLEGAAKLDLDMKSYSKTRTSRMLQAALSEDPNQLVAFLVGEIGEATPDISYGGLDRAPNGVSIVPNPAAATPPKTDQPD